jgi:hypothetical protein
MENRVTVSSSAAKKLARRLLRENRHGRSWRAIAHEDYQDRISFATLNRIAIHKGEWLPKDENVLILLGLKKPHREGPRLPKWLQPTEQAVEWFTHQRQTVKDMAKDTREEVAKFRKGQ